MKRDTLERPYWWLQSFIAPSLRSSQCVYEDILSARLPGTHVWLDLGSGHSLLPPWRLDQERLLVQQPRFVVGLDRDLPSLSSHKTITNRVQGDISWLPFTDHSFDLVTANTVLEHLENPREQMQEIARTIRPGGKLIVHTPNRHGYTTCAARAIPRRMRVLIAQLLHGRQADDIYPTYYQANSASRLRKLAEFAGMRVASIDLVCTSAQLALLPGIVVFELLLLRMLMTRPMTRLRTNIVAVFEKPLGEHKASLPSHTP